MAGKRRGTDSIIGGAMLLAVSNIACRLLGFLYKIPLANLIGSEGMGYIGFAGQVFGAATTIALAGMPLTLSRMAAERRKSGRERGVLKPALYVFGLIGAAGALLMLALAKPVSSAAGSPQAALSVAALAPGVLFVCLSAARRAYFQGCSRFAPGALSQVADAAVKLAFGIAAAWYLFSKGMPPEAVAAGAVLGITAGNIAAEVVLLFASRGECAPSSERGIAGKLIGESLPLTIGAAVLSLLGTADTVLLMSRLRASGLTEGAASALYGAYTGYAMTFFWFPSSITSAVTASLVPAVAAVDKAGPWREKIMRSFSSALRLSMLVTVPAAALFALMPGELMSMIFSRQSDVAIAAPLLRAVSPALLLASVAGVSAAVLQAMGKTVVPVVASALGAGVRIAAHLALAGRPEVRIMAAAIGLTAGFAVTAAIDAVCLCRTLKAVPKLREALLAPTICAVPAALSAKALYAPASGFIGARAAAALCLLTAAAVFLLAAYAAGLLKGLGRLKRTNKLASDKDGINTTNERIYN